MSDDDMGDMPIELPEGVQKEVMTPALDGSWKRPQRGDEVTVHYVGTLQSDGSEFDSSRSRGRPFVFTLGRGEVIKGWDLGVATMKKGEVSKFTFAPEFAYGENGSPPKIPENATLVFEVELISWRSKSDLFGDEGVILTRVTEGSGWRTRQRGARLSESGGPIAKACDKALQSMKVGEEVQLKCSKDYAYGDRSPDGATVTIKLSQIYETTDVSFESNRSVMKKQVVEGEGYEMPQDGAQVTLEVEAATDASGQSLSGFQAKTLEFVLGNGDVCDALECAAKAAAAQLGLSSLDADTLRFTLTLKDFAKTKETWSMSEEEKLEFGAQRKEVGTSLFKSGRFTLALQRYKKVAELFDYVDNFKAENKAKAKELKKLCKLNQAACYLKLGDHFEAKRACDAVLKEDSQNLKALLRRAQAQFGMKNFLDCVQDCKRLVELDPQNRDSRSLLKRAHEGQAEEDRRSKKLFATMCKALGKGPIPAPEKAKMPHEEKEHFDMQDPAKTEGEMAEVQPAPHGGRATLGEDHPPQTLSSMNSHVAGLLVASTGLSRILFLKTLAHTPALKSTKTQALGRGELSKYFRGPYLTGEVYQGSLYSNSSLGDLRTFDYIAPDGLVSVWRHAVILCDPQGQERPDQRDLCVLYHFTNELAFRNVADMEQTTAELFASLVDSRAHFGKGVYCTQHEPAVWGSRTRILLNNYSNLSPLRDTADPEAQRVEEEWGRGNAGGHRAAFCIPIIVSRELAYNIFEKQTPDLAQKMVRDADTGKERKINLGEDYRGRKVDPARDVWVVQVTDDSGRVKHAGAEADGLLRLLRRRLANLRRQLGDDAKITLDCMGELARRLRRRALREEAEQLFQECLRRRRAKLGEEHPDTLASMNNLAGLLQASSWAFASARQKGAILGEVLRRAMHQNDAQNSAWPRRRCQFLSDPYPGRHNWYNTKWQDRGRYEEAEPLYRQALEIRSGLRGLVA
ncbi:FKBP65 [Symbiodinium sp. CCMP2456]|nr:FKBP65 [Symbiodinium sp. CCMP2456]